MCIISILFDIVLDLLANIIREIKQLEVQKL